MTSLDRRTRSVSRKDLFQHFAEAAVSAAPEPQCEIPHITGKIFAIGALPERLSCNGSSIEGIPVYGNERQGCLMREHPI
jgi:hypothetical protein